MQAILDEGPKAQDRGWRRHRPSNDAAPVPGEAPEAGLGRRQQGGGGGPHLRTRPTGAGRVPRTTYRQLTPDVRERPLRIVGIDLTGSEDRPSGWCLLTDDHALTQRIRSDLDLISETVCARPHVVSIDSPLSLPYGRTRPTDDDPTRDEFGITRECERLLRARGVHVYPTLILNMQGLTARGIRLATHFRKLGIPVIESYPGAAQDILGIPRKKKGVEHLTRALLDFGVRGPISSCKLSHDELDAVTSAMVGLFFWTGKFEALGNGPGEFSDCPGPCPSAPGLVRTKRRRPERRDRDRQDDPCPISRRLGVRVRKVQRGA